MKNPVSKSESGQVSVNKMVGVAVGLLVGGILFASLLPTAINELASATLDSEVSSSTSTLFYLLPLFISVAALLTLINVIDG